jgi:peptidyl-prolyl cis-trans isomerase C
MHMLEKIIFKPKLFICLLVVLLVSCSNATPQIEMETPTSTNMPATPTSETPTPTLIPAAAVVNGERIPLDWYESELSRYLLAQEALGQPVEDEGSAREIVINDLVDQVLLAQAAQAAGYAPGEADVQTRLDQLAQEVDLTAWMEEWGYSESDLFDSLLLQMKAAFQRDAIVASVPENMAQVELRQIFAYTQEGAENALISLNSGRDFEEVAFIYDPIAGGYLGWVPRGYLLIPAVEEAAFALPVGEHSDIIESEIGYHIVMVLAAEERKLTSDARLTLQRRALHAWLAEQREQSTIEVLLD